MPKNNIMWNLMMLRVQFAIENFFLANSSEIEKDRELLKHLAKEHTWAISRGPYRFIKFFKGVTP